MLAIISVTAPRVAVYVYGLLTLGGAVTVSILMVLFRRRFQVIVAHLRVIEGSTFLWFAMGVLTGYGYNIVFILALVYFLFAPLVVAHDRP